MTPNKPKTPMRSVRIPDDIWTATLALAKARGETASDVIRAALSAHLRNQVLEGGQS